MAFSYLCKRQQHVVPSTKTDNDDTGKESQVPKQDKGKPKSNLALGTALGLLGGCAIGAICDDIGTWMLIGVMLGAALGLASSNDRQKPNETQEK